MTPTPSCRAQTVTSSPKRRSAFMNAFATKDELFWNVDGALWPVPRQAVSATVTLPVAMPEVSTTRYEGPTGSRELCAFSGGSGMTFAFSSKRELASGEQMSVAVGIPKGTIAVAAPLLEPRERRFPQDAFDFTPLIVGLSLLIGGAGVGLVAWNWLRHGRDRAYLTQYYLTNDPREQVEPLFQHDPLVVEFASPQGMKPALLGLILDENADTKDVTATIVDLAVGGFMTISEVPGASDWLFTWKGAGSMAALLPYEKTILDGIFEGCREVKLRPEGNVRSDVENSGRSGVRRSDGAQAVHVASGLGERSLGLPRYCAHRAGRWGDVRARRCIWLGSRRQRGGTGGHGADGDIQIDAATIRPRSRPAAAHAWVPSLHDDRREVPTTVRGESADLHAATPLRDRLRMRVHVGEGVRRNRHERIEQLVRR